LEAICGTLALNPARERMLPSRSNAVIHLPAVNDCRAPENVF